MVTLLGGYLSITLKLSCPSNMSSYFLRIVLYIDHTRSDIHRPLGFHWKYFISSYLGDEALILYEYLTFVSEFKETVALSWSQAYGDNNTWFDTLKCVCLVLVPILRINIWNLILQIWHLACSHFIVSASSNYEPLPF